jgi:hypothetical protein
MSAYKIQTPGNYPEENIQQGMLAIIQCTMLCLSVSYPKISRLKYTELQFCQSFCLGVKLSHSDGVWEQGAEILGPKRDEVAVEWRSGRDL